MEGAPHEMDCAVCRCACYPILLSPMCVCRIYTCTGDGLLVRLAGGRLLGSIGRYYLEQAKLSVPYLPLPWTARAAGTREWLPVRPSIYLSTHLSIHLGDWRLWPRLPAEIGHDGLTGWDEGARQDKDAHTGLGRQDSDKPGVELASLLASQQEKGYCDPVSAIISLQITGQAPTPSSQPESALPSVWCEESVPRYPIDCSTRTLARPGL